MGYGELPARASMRGYWKLEDVNDSSGNARTLTNENSVVFNPGRFRKAADFGSSGTTQTLSLVATILSSNTAANVTFSFWYKLNNTTSSNANARFFEVSSNPGATSMFALLIYNISGGNISFSFSNQLTGVSAAVGLVMPVDTKWHHIVCIISAGITVKMYHNGGLVASNTGSGTYGIAPSALRRWVIGASRNVTLPCWAMIDEFILEEREWSASEIRKYYTQGQGRLVAA